MPEETRHRMTKHKGNRLILACCCIVCVPLIYLQILIHASTVGVASVVCDTEKKCIRVERIRNTEEPYELPLSLRLRSALSSISIGGHLAAQAVANLAAAAFFTIVLKISFVSYIPTALRLGAGCGISMLVSVLGMRNVGLLIANSFTLQPVTWQTVS